MTKQTDKTKTKDDKKSSPKTTKQPNVFAAKPNGGGTSGTHGNGTGG